MGARLQQISYDFLSTWGYEDKKRRVRPSRDMAPAPMQSQYLGRLFLGVRDHRGHFSKDAARNKKSAQL